jgi:hypothetical protein
LGLKLGLKCGRIRIRSGTADREGRKGRGVDVQKLQRKDPNSAK